MRIVDLLKNHPDGLSPGAIEKLLGVSRSTVNRQLKNEIELGLVVADGDGPSRIYRDADPFSAIKAYFERPHTERPLARYDENRLLSKPEVRFEIDPASFLPLEKRELTSFLIDFSCASSLLEGGTYSLLDTQALIEYGEKASGRPIKDAFLILNHKNAFEFLYDHPSMDSIFKVQDLLTDDHNLPDLSESEHFLESRFRGRPREYEDVNIKGCTYLPPFRPGTGYVTKMLDRMLSISESIPDPVSSAFYLMTRLPYLQPFKDGNKRTSRVMCNVPLLNNGLPPISFVDFNKKDYIVSMLAFYELGDEKMAAKCFAEAYEKSCIRLNLKPSSKRMRP